MNRRERFKNIVEKLKEFIYLKDLPHNGSWPLAREQTPRTHLQEAERYLD